MQKLGDLLYLICDDGDFMTLGKELEVYANHDFAVACLKFLFDKFELHHTVWVLRFGLHDWYEQFCKNDVSKIYLEEASEEIKR